MANSYYLQNYTIDFLYKLKLIKSNNLNMYEDYNYIINKTILPRSHKKKYNGIT